MKSIVPPAALWFLSLIPIFLALGTPPVTRTQEARVLETAREMHDFGGSRWLIPQMNGKLRLEKPPLAYWLAAIGFEIGGVNDWAGRAPFALCAWLTIGAVSWIARETLGATAGVFASASLLGMMMFARLGRFAETDGLSSLFVTLAISCIWRAERSIEGQRGIDKRFHVLSGVAIGFAVLSKGPPAAFALLFLAGLAAMRSDWKLFARWARSGAPIAAIVIGLPWFAYAIHRVGYDTFRHELAALRGAEHQASSLEYLPQLLRATLPWTGFAIVAITAAVMSWKRDERARVLLVWCMAIAVPLLLAGQRQYHYLFPILTPVALLIGWFIAEAIEPLAEARVRKTLALVFWITVICLILAAIALPVVAPQIRGERLKIDWAAAMSIVLVCCIAIIVGRRSLGAGVGWFSLGGAVLMILLVSAWAPTLTRANDPRMVAKRVRALSDGSNKYCFYGENFSMPLIYELRTIAPVIGDERALIEWTSARPNGLILSIARPQVPAPALPSAFVQLDEISTEERTLRVYRAR